MRLSIETPFTRNARTIGSALSLCCKIFEGAMGHDHPAAQSRIATDPKGVLSELQEILLAARARILLAPEPEVAAPPPQEFPPDDDEHSDGWEPVRPE